MKTIGRRLLSRCFPVGINDEPLGRPQNFHAFIAAKEKHIVVPLRIAEEFVERRPLDIPCREDETTI